MGVITRAKQLVLGGSDGATGEDEPDGEPSHVCDSCGEKYYTNPETEINKCRSCGGVKVQPA